MRTGAAAAGSLLGLAMVMVSCARTPPEPVAVAPSDAAVGEVGKSPEEPAPAHGEASAAPSGATLDASARDASPDAAKARVDGGGVRADCTWIKAPANGWRVFLRSVDDCLGPAPTATKMAPDGKSCSSPSGEIKIVFNRPLASPPKKVDAVDSDFTIERNGRACLRRVSTIDGSVEAATHREGVRFVGPNGVTVNAILGPQEAKVVCPGEPPASALLHELLIGPCAAEARQGGFPVTDFVRGKDGEATFRLGGLQQNPVFSCR